MLSSLLNIEPNYQKIYDSVYHAMNEATYYGKNSQLLRCEHMLDDICDHVRKRGYMLSGDIDDLQKVGDLLAKIFGFKRITVNGSLINLFPSVLLSSTLNTSAATFCKSTIYKYTSYATGKLKTEKVVFDKSHEGVRFSNDHYYVMNLVLSGDLFNARGEYTLTGEEILAVIMHEIGHNFYIGPVREFASEAMCMFSFDDFATYIGALLGGLLATHGPDKLLETDFGMNMSNNLRGLITQVSNVIGPIVRTAEGIVAISSGITMILKFVDGLLLKDLTKVAYGILAYDDEKYADSFATAYGYGASLYSGLDKLTHFTVVNDNKQAGKLLNAMRPIYTFPVDVLGSILDPHPQNEARLNNNLKYMEAASKNIKNTKVRKEYEQEVQRLRGMKDEIKSYQGKNPDANYRKCALMLQDITHITDIKDVTSFLIPKWTRYKNIDL